MHVLGWRAPARDVLTAALTGWSLSTQDAGLLEVVAMLASFLSSAPTVSDTFSRTDDPAPYAEGVGPWGVGSLAFTRLRFKDSSLRRLALGSMVSGDPRSTSTVIRRKMEVRLL